MTTAPALPGSGSKTHMLLPAALLVVLALIVVPLPTPLLDVLITIDLALGITVLLVAMYVPGPTEFSALPSLILLLTLFRLALNIASTRLVLLHGENGTRAAGVVIESFGKFVVGGSFAVGLVIFLLLLVVQFVVISHGSIRISEVIARFTLDALPGKQMAIDADLNAGLITEREALARRAAVQHEAEFFGSMDGAVRFTQRDAIAALLIVAVNIVAGLLIGVLQKGMNLRHAFETYSTLTIGDGLVTAIPALLVATASGIITTRAAQQRSLGEEVTGQLLSSPRPLRLAAGTLFVLALIPGLPKVSFLVLAATIYAGSRIAAQREAEVAERAHAEVDAATAKPAAAEEDLEPYLAVDPLCLEVGYDLISAVGADRAGGILDKIKGLRRQMATGMGFVLPPVRVRDNLQLSPDQYAILLRGVKVAGGRVPRGRLLALEAGQVRPIAGEKTSDPAFGMPALWITPDMADEARGAGYTVVDPPSVISTHLMEIIQRNAAELLTREDTARLIEQLQKTHPKAVGELIPERMTVGEVQRVLQGLLRESVPIRDLPVIVEALADAAPQTRDTAQLVESARRALGRAITGSIVDPRGAVRGVTLAPELEDELIRAFVSSGGESLPQSIAPARAREIVLRIGNALAGSGAQAALVVGPRLRPYAAALMRPHAPHTPVLSTLEIPPEVTLRSVALVS